MKKAKDLLILLFLLLATVSGGCNDSDELSRSELNVNNVTDVDEYNNAKALVLEFSDQINVGNNSTRSAYSITLNEVKKIGVSGITTRNSVDSISLYTFNLDFGEDKGYAIATGDANIAKVYAYVEKGSISDSCYIKGMADMLRIIPYICIADFQEYYNDSIPETKSISTRTTTLLYGPLIKTQWGQDYPYNLKCPILSCGRAYAGCGVIAVSQAIAYYKKHISGYDFAALTAYPKITSTSSTYLIEHCSSFIRYVGDILEADWGCDGTSTYFVTCRDKLRDLGYSILYHPDPRGNYFLAGRAVAACQRGDITFVRGTDTASGGGHMWIIDGAMGIQYYPRLAPVFKQIHCNFGWYGRGDGWYSVSGEDAFIPQEGTTQLASYTRNIDAMYMNEMD